MSQERRRKFLSGIAENILLPYEASTIYEEEIAGEFQNRFEREFFEDFATNVHGDKIVLDLACGDGRHTSGLAERAKHVVALDLSTNMLRMAKRKCSAETNIDFVRGSMFDLPFRENVFDQIWFSQAFEYVPPDKRKEFLSDLKASLEGNGFLYMSVESWMYPGFFESLKEFLGDLELHFYWRFVKGKPLLWGEFMYYLAGDVRERCRGWHYHVHTDRWTLQGLLSSCNFEILRQRLYDGYIYVLCAPKNTKARRKLERANTG